MARLKIVIAGAILSLSAVGCRSIPYSTVKLYHDSVGAAYVRYLENDQSLDADSKRIRRQTYDSMERTLAKMGG